MISADHEQLKTSRLLSSQKSICGQVLPIRLIDIPATIRSLAGGIHFVVPSDWSFHVISHTWSLEVRNFSEQVGKQILHLSHAADDHHDGADYSSSFSRYNSHFQQIDLRGKPAYNELIEFLSFLADDGVTYAWFDALCINQTDEREKSKEIANMGAYYGNSQGCYVLVHGIGKGYSLWGSNEQIGHIPRWFTRVWTLREFVLPRRLTFLTELSGRTDKIVKGLITKANSSIGFCRCCIPKNIVLEEPPRGHGRERLEFLRSSGIDIEVIHRDKPFKIRDYLGGSEVAVKEWLNSCFSVHEDLFPGLTMISSDTVCAANIDQQSACPTCGTPSLVRRVQSQRSLYHSGAPSNSSSSAELYMVEKEAYLFLLYLDTFFPLNCSYAGMTRVFELNRRFSIWDPWRAISEIVERKCSNEEDRVLGILGLLGVGGEMQVRTKDSLEQHLVNLGRYCKSADPDLLLKLCLVQQFGGSQPGISWAPDLRDPTQSAEVWGLSVGSTISPFQHHSEGPARCCRHLVLGEDVLPQPIDVPKVEISMAKVVSDLHRLSHFQRKVEVLDCSAHGITLEARGVVGQVMPYEMLPPNGQATVKQVMTQAATLMADQEREDSLPFRQWKMQGGVIGSPAEHTPTHCIYLEEAGICLPLIVTLFCAFDTEGYTHPALIMADAVSPWNMMRMDLKGNRGAGEALEGLGKGGHRLEDGRVRIEMEVWLLWLGSTVGEERKSSSYDVAMVCLGRRRRTEHVELHKVGVFALPTSTEGDAIFDVAETRYLLGGFGANLSAFAHVSLVKKTCS